MCLFFFFLNWIIKWPTYPTEIFSPRVCDWSFWKYSALTLWMKNNIINYQILQSQILQLVRWTLPASDIQQTETLTNFQYSHSVQTLLSQRTSHFQRAGGSHWVRLLPSMPCVSSHLGPINALIRDSRNQSSWIGVGRCGREGEEEEENSRKPMEQEPNNYEDHTKFVSTTSKPILKKKKNSELHEQI